MKAWYQSPHCTGAHNSARSRELKRFQLNAPQFKRAKTCDTCMHCKSRRRCWMNSCWMNSCWMNCSRKKCKVTDLLWAWINPSIDVWAESRTNPGVFHHSSASTPRQRRDEAVTVHLARLVMTFHTPLHHWTTEFSPQRCSVGWFTLHKGGLCGLTSFTKLLLLDKL